MRDVNSDTGVGRPGATGDERNAGPASFGSVQCAISTRHEGSPAFLPACHRFDRSSAVEGIQNCKEAFPRNSENAIGTLFDKALDQQLSSRFRHAFFSRIQQRA